MGTRHHIPKVSVIIPVYKAEAYIERCLHSLFGQTLDDIEYIFIDDCSPDNSVEIIKTILRNYPHRDSQVRLLRNSKNSGVGQSRQKGIEEATGKYIIHCDPDDWLELNMYQLLYTTAEKDNADIVVCDYICENGNESSVEKLVYPTDSKVLVDAIAEGRMHSYLWNKLVLNSFYKKTGVKIEKGINLWEDMALVVPLFLSASIISYTPYALYHYNTINSSSLVHNQNQNSTLSTIKAAEYIESYLYQHNISQSSYLSSILKIKFRALAPLLRKKQFNPDLWLEKVNLPWRKAMKYQSRYLQMIIVTLIYLKFYKLVRFLVCLK